MDEQMSPAVKNAETGATFVGLLTTAIGLGLLTEPARTARFLGVRGGLNEKDDRILRILGAIDLTVANGLLFGRPRWPWMAARAVCNPPTAIYLVRLGRRTKAKAPYLLPGVILAATLVDAGAVRALRATGR